MPLTLRDLCVLCGRCWLIFDASYFTASAVFLAPFFTPWPTAFPILLTLARRRVGLIECFCGIFPGVPTAFPVSLAATLVACAVSLAAILVA